MLGADPDTVTDSLTSGATVTTSSGSASSSLIDHGTRIAAARIDDENFEGRRRIGLPLEPSVGCR